CVPSASQMRKKCTVRGTTASTSSKSPSPSALPAPSALLAWSRQAERFQPEIKLLDPVVARLALFAHAKAVTTRAKDMQFRFVTRGFERLVEAGHERFRTCV